MAFTSITAAAVTAGKAVTQTLMNLIRTNFDDHEARIVSLEAATIVNGFVVGEIRIWSSSALPSGFLWCDGSAVSRTVTYANLFAVVGTVFGIGDGATTFNLPDLRGRVPVGQDTMNNTVGTGGGAASRMTSGGSGVDGATIGAVGGSQTHTLVTGELSVHNHGITDPQHSHGITDPGHLHSAIRQSTVSGALPYLQGGNDATLVANQNSINTATTGVTVNNASTGVTVNNSGSGTAHNNTQPVQVCTYIIRY